MRKFEMHPFAQENLIKFEPLKIHPNISIMIIKSNGFIHHVFFWLKDPASKEAIEQLSDGLKKLSKMPLIKEFHIGKPASTNRGVIDNSYSVSWLLLFENAEDQDVYQTHSMHLKFIEECAHLWNKVVVYDTISF